MKIKQLDGLRGLLALSLVFFHFSPKGTFITDNFIIRHADLFVDFFFVLSGFVIALNYQEKINSLATCKTYLVKRFARIYPLLLYTVLLEFVIQLIINNLAAGVLQHPKTNGLLVTMFFKSALLFNGTPVLGKINGINEPTWSISAEAISYCIFGMLVLVYKKYIVPFSIVIVVLCTLFFLMIGRFITVDDFGFIRGIFGFHLGVLVYNLVKKKAQSNAILEILYVVILLIGLYMVDKTAIPLFKMLFPFYFAIGVAVFSAGNGIVTAFLNSRMMQFLGKISYSVYLNHVLVLYIIYTLSFQVFKFRISTATTLITVIIYTIAVILYSSITNKYVEQWGNAQVKKRLIKRKNK